MDINEALNRIIYKYNLDYYYPHYRNMCEAQKILRDIVQNIVQSKKKAVFVGDDLTGLEFVHNISGDYDGIDFLLYDRGKQTPQEIQKADQRKYEEIYLLSFLGVEHVERWFRQHNISCQWIYDVFERKGIVLQREFFVFGKEDLYYLVDAKGAMRRRTGWTEATQCELYCQQSKYRMADDERTRQTALQKCLFLALYMRNFILAKRYSLLLAEYDKRYEAVWAEIQELLNRIGETIRRRKQKDIVLYWLDAIPYCDVDSLPYLQTVMKESVVFENAFTYIPYTHPTLRAMFLGKKDIDDQAYMIAEITRDNSPVMQMLEDQGYDIRVYSGYFSDFFPRAYRSGHYYTDVCAPVSMKLWDMFADMLLSEQKTLWLVHALESHAPYLNTAMNDNNYQEAGEMRRLARMEVSEQLAFYDAFANEDTFRIYMSDHGDGTMLPRRIQIFFGVCHKAWKPKRIKGLFSLLDFGMVIKKIVMEGEIREADFTRGYVEIGNLDLYNPSTIRKLFQNKEDINEIYYGYKGIVDEEYIYTHYTTGKEWLSRRKEMRSPILFYECADDICDPGLLPRYRELTGEYPEEIFKNEKFKYSQCLHDLYQRVLAHHDVAKRVGLIEQLLDKYPDHSVGVRMGGYHSLVLYYVLSEKCRQKIWGFLDNNADCLCNTLSLPIVRTDEFHKLYEQGVKAVVLSSYIHIEALRKEAGNWPADMDRLDIYQCFHEKGILCNTDFWIVKGRDEDYDMGLRV